MVDVRDATEQLVDLLKRRPIGLPAAHSGTAAAALTPGEYARNGVFCPRDVIASCMSGSQTGIVAHTWACAHRGKWGQLTP